MNFEDLVVCLRIEEDNRVIEKRGNQTFQFKAKANIVEHVQKNKKRKQLANLQIRKRNTLSMKRWGIVQKTVAVIKITEVPTKSKSILGAI